MGVVPTIWVQVYIPYAAASARTSQRSKWAIFSSLSENSPIPNLRETVRDRAGNPRNLLTRYPRPDYFSLARGDDSSTHRSTKSWYINSMATGLMFLTHGWWAITALL